MTMTKPTIDSAHVIPESSGRPMNEKAVWKLTISHATTHSSGASTVSNIEVIDSSVVGWPGRSAGLRGQPVCRSVTIGVKSGGCDARTYVRDPDVDVIDTDELVSFPLRFEDPQPG